MRRRVRRSRHRFSSPRPANTWPLQHEICITSHRAATSLEPADRVVPLSAQMIGLRFTVAAEAACIERHVTAHSGRVGLVSELTSRGASTTDVMLAGNWKTSRMVAHYSAGPTAERGAVARYL